MAPTCCLTQLSMDLLHDGGVVAVIGQVFPEPAQSPQTLLTFGNKMKMAHRVRLLKRVGFTEDRKASPMWDSIVSEYLKGAENGDDGRESRMEDALPESFGDQQQDGLIRVALRGRGGGIETDIRAVSRCASVTRMPR